jgi:FMN phosphatase YigB (HAD superfamily)
MVLVFSHMLSATLSLTPDNTIIISDIDDVLIQPSFFLSSIAQLKNLVGDYKKDADGVKEALVDKKGNSINGMTFHLLYHGMRKSYLTPYISWMAENLETSRQFINGTEKIYRYLKTKGYTIIFATNKDRIGYDFTAQSLGNAFTSLASKVFVAHPGNNPEFIAQLQTFADLASTPKSYKEFLQKTLTIQPTDMILHAPERKPDQQYYNYVEQHLDAAKNMVFIDDKATNVAGFVDTLKNQSSAERIGIVFKDARQLAQDLVNLGILSEIDDQKLLEEIRYPGLWGKINYFLTAKAS